MVFRCNGSENCYTVVVGRKLAHVGCVCRLGAGSRAQVFCGRLVLPIDFRRLTRAGFCLIIYMGPMIVIICSSGTSTCVHAFRDVP